MTDNVIPFSKDAQEFEELKEFMKNEVIEKLKSLIIDIENDEVDILLLASKSNSPKRVSYYMHDISCSSPLETVGLAKILLNLTEDKYFHDMNCECDCENCES